MTQSKLQDAAAAGRDLVIPRKRPVALIVALVVILVACVVGGLVGGSYLIGTYTQIKDVENSQSIEPVLPAGADQEARAAQEASDVQVGSVDFSALQEQNPDIYAWIFIPDSGINYPVCQHPEDNAYYLTHGAAGQESEIGAIFSEAQFNHKDFQDPVTVLYGHNGFGNTMFTNLHNYERQEFLDAHDKVYVYTPDRIFTYQVFSTFLAGDRHIMDAFNFQEEEGFTAFVDFLKEPQSIDAHVQDVEVGARDKILVLSTCTTGAFESTGRYLVCGVLIDDQANE